MRPETRTAPLSVIADHAPVCPNDQDC